MCESLAASPGDDVSRKSNAVFVFDVPAGCERDTRAEFSTARFHYRAAAQRECVCERAREVLLLTEEMDASAVVKEVARILLVATPKCYNNVTQMRVKAFIRRSDTRL